MAASSEGIASQHITTAIGGGLSSLIKIFYIIKFHKKRKDKLKSIIMIDYFITIYIEIS
jgi:hypothetical protein